METENERLEYAIQETQVLRPPRQALATFGITCICYYLLTVPSYAELVGGGEETVVREGQVIAERPRVVTPYYLLNLEGFSPHARKYLEKAAREEGPSSPALFYRYRNEARGLTIVSEPLAQLAAKLTEKLERERTNLASVIKGVDEMWDVSLLKFIHELTVRSLPSNIMELGRRGLLDIDRAGVPADARQCIEHLFRQVQQGKAEPRELKVEIDSWGLWPEYEDRFLALFRRQRP